MRTSNLLFCILSIFGLTLAVFPHSWAQLDTVGFPLDVGNKWYYRFSGGYVSVREIVDTMLNGDRVVRIYRLHQDSVTIGVERWATRNGNFYINTEALPIYNAALAHDTTWTQGQNTYAYQLGRVTIFGSSRNYQRFYLQHTEPPIAYWWGDRRVALGIGLYYNRQFGASGEISWNYADTLIGLLINGQFFGDTVLTTVEDEKDILPASFELNQNYPNPFNPSTTIRFQVGEVRGQKSDVTHVTLKVFDLLGREVATLVDEEMGPGKYERAFNAVGLASGVYLYQLRAGSFVQTKKLLLLR